jgi:chromosome segregation ATPase
MTLSISDQSYVVSDGVTYLPADTPTRPGRNIRLNDRPARRAEGLSVDVKRRISTLRRLIADCDRMASNLDQEVRNEENRVKVHDPANIVYSTYAKATASRRDNLRRSADELRSHLSKAEQLLGELGETSPL